MPLIPDTREVLAHGGGGKLKFESWLGPLNKWVQAENRSSLQSHMGVALNTGKCQK